MVKCKICGYTGEYTSEPCPICNSKIILSDEELSGELEKLREAIKNKEYKKAVSGYRLLAENGYIEAEKEYAKILERGRLAPRNLDLAMDYFFRAAKKNDAYSAYRYSLLVSRENDGASLFWLIFSAILGCEEAFCPAADEFIKLGYTDDAIYFYNLASESGNADATVKLAEIYFSGHGIKRSEEYAKWYMDKLKLPPIYAIKLAYKLRGKKAEKPPEPSPKNYFGLLRKLRNEAHNRGYGTAYFKLSKILADKGDGDSMTTVGEALIQGNGCKQNFAEGLKLLTRSAEMGNASAHISLARFYSDGKHTEKCADMALRHYVSAGELGDADSYETAGDIYYTGNGIAKDISKAMELYDLAIELGSLSALNKSNTVKREREALYKNALLAEAENPDESFSKYSGAYSMGHVEATYRLGLCYEFGIGTRINRKAAFQLYKRAVALGKKSALLSLGLCYAHGIGTKLDYSLAREALSEAERNGVEGATAAIQSIMERKKSRLGKRYYSTAMRLIYEKKFGLAREYLDLAAKFENPRAIYALGCLFEFGMGAPCDKERAFALYEKAYSMLFRDPRAKYKLSILRMIKSK